MQVAIEVTHLEQALADLKNAVLFLERANIVGGEALAMINAISRVRQIGTTLENTARNINFPAPGGLPVGEPDPQPGEEEGR